MKDFNYLTLVTKYTIMAKIKGLCDPLPESFYNNIKNPADDAKTFVESKVNEADRREVADEFKKTLVLEAQRSKRRQRQRKPRISKKELTAREKRNLGLNRLPKVGLKYEQFKVCLLNYRLIF